MKNSLIIAVIATAIISGCASSSNTMLVKKEEKTNVMVSKSDIMKNDFIDELALHDAVRSKDLAMVELLVSNKIEINSQNNEGYTPLHLAVRLNEYEIVEFLIKNGARVNTTDKYKDTPLLDSTRDNYSEISKILLCNDANRDVFDEYENTPLHNSTKNKNLEISNMLISDNLDFFCKTDEMIEELTPEVQDEVSEDLIEEEPMVSQIVNQEIDESTFTGLYEALVSEFQNDFDIWNAELTEDDLTFRFNNPLALFENGKSDLKPGFTNILNDFFPRYLKILAQYKDKISEIRIEGHTSSVYRGATSDEQKYSLNKVLSDKRAKEVRNYVVYVVNETQNSSIIDKEWTENTFKGYGMSSDNLITDLDGSENVSASRRVEFKIIKI